MSNYKVTKKNELNSKRKERIEKRQYLTDRFLTHFVFGIIFSVYVIGLEMATVANYPKFAQGVRFWTFVGGILLALILVFLPKFKKIKTGFMWRTSVYFFAFLGGLHGLIELWVKLKILDSVAFLKIFKFGNEWGAWSWSHGLIWIGVGVSFVNYVIKYNKKYN